MNQLKQNNSRGKEVELDVLLKDTPEKLHPIKFDAIDPDLAKKNQLKQEVEQDYQKKTRKKWKRILITKQFCSASTGLYTVIVRFITKLCTIDILSPLLEVVLYVI